MRSFGLLFFASTYYQTIAQFQNPLLNDEIVHT